MARFFNERAQTDLFSLWGRNYIISVDEGIRWALCCHLQSKERNEWFRVFLIGWVRYFGPPLTLTSDQEGAVISDLIGRACEAYNIERDLTGPEGHTATGVCERRLG